VVVSIVLVNVSQLGERLMVLDDG